MRAGDSRPPARAGRGAGRRVRDRHPWAETGAERPGFVRLRIDRLAGQTFAAGTLLYSVGALAGAVIGTVIGLRWMSERTTRYVLAVILLFAGVRLLLR
jgi:hypothetical protein